MREPVLSIFKLVLIVFAKLTLDAIYISLRVSKIFAKQGLKFVLAYRNVWLYLDFILVLILIAASTDTVPKKRGCEQVAIIASDLCYEKIVLALLAEPIVIYV